ncbi:MAG: hypothetical protein GZ087_08905 [Flavobacterium sp.]|nr:hypothetical protein [Flavobacterium sp.]
MNKFLRIFILSLLFLSCSSDLDFNQVNDLKLEPVVVANLASFDIQANKFVVGGVEQPVTGDVMDFNVFKDSNFNEILKRADLHFEFYNTINRDFKINLIFLDANNSPLFTIPFDIAANSSLTKTEIFENTKLDLVKQTKKVAFVITLLPGTPLTDSSLGSLKLRSNAIIYFVIQ